MKLTKSLLLASVAGFAAVASAQAADLPSKKAAPVEYVKVCPTYGPGFFYIPGTNTCLRIGGAVTFDYQHGETYVRAADKTGMFAGARLIADARDNTEYGLLRTFIQLDVNRATGQRTTGSGTRIAYAINTTGAQYAGSQTQVQVSRAFVQIAGFTVGVMPSFYSFGYQAGMIGLEGGDAGFQAQGIAYTAALGQGFSATLAVEDSANRREAINGAGAVNNGMPDVIGNLRLEQGWGSIQLSGAVHEVRDTVNAGASASSVGAEYGYAGQLGVRVNLPMLAAGSSIVFQGGVSHGASNYTLSNIATATGSSGAVGALGTAAGVNGSGVGTIGTNIGDAVWNGTKLELIDAWTLGVMLNHQFTPRVAGFIGGSYTQIEFPADAKASLLGAAATYANQPYNDANVMRVTGGAVWTPITGLNIIGEVQYAKMDLGIAQTTVNNGDKKSDSAITTRFRVTRAF